jgi:hypothetical protein
MNSSRIALVGFLLGALLLAPQVRDTAGASALARASNTATQMLSTGTYLAAAVTSTGATNPLAAYSVTNGGNTNPQSFFIKNFGTAGLIGVSFSATTTNGSLTFTRCPVGTTFSTAKLCSDGSNVIPTAPGAFTVSFSPGQSVPMRAIPSKSGVTITLDVTLTSAQQVAATNTVS